MVDVAWVDATDLMVLGASMKTAADDAVPGLRRRRRICRKASPIDWNAVELTVQQRTQTVIVRGQDRPDLARRRRRLVALVWTSSTRWPTRAEVGVAGGGRIGRSSLSAAGDLLLGARCHGCGSPGLGDLSPVSRAVGRPPRVHRRGRIRARRVPALREHGSVRRPTAADCIVAHKERQALALTALLGDRLALGIRGAAQDPAEPRVAGPHGPGALGRTGGPGPGVRRHRGAGPRAVRRLGIGRTAAPRTDSPGPGPAGWPIRASSMRPNGRPTCAAGCGCATRPWGRHDRGRRPGDHRSQPDRGRSGPRRGRRSSARRGHRRRHAAPSGPDARSVLKPGDRGPRAIREANP